MPVTVFFKNGQRVTMPGATDVRVVGFGGSDMAVEAYSAGKVGPPQVHGQFRTSEVVGYTVGYVEHGDGPIGVQVAES